MTTFTIIVVDWFFKVSKENMSSWELGAVLSSTSSIVGVDMHRQVVDFS